MKEILDRLCRTPGVTGAVLASDDGLLICASSGLGDRQAEELAAAVVGALGRAVNAAVSGLGGGGFRSVQLAGVGGRAMLLRSGDAFLVALLDNHVDMGVVHLELGAAANEAARSISL